MKAVFLLISLCVLSLTAFGQISAVMTEYGDLLPSRGAFVVVKGTGLAPATELAVDVSNLPTDLGGVRVEIDGVACRLRYVSPDVIRLVIPDEVPFIPPVRLRPNNLTIKTTTGAVLWTRRVYLNDTSPWLLPNKATQWPVGMSFNQASGVSSIVDGAISVKGETRVTLWATGARSFYPADWVYYYVYVIDGRDNVYELPASVSRFALIDGVDVVVFDVPAEWAGMGECRLLLRTPSAFSQEVKVTF